MRPKPDKVVLAIFLDFEQGMKEDRKMERNRKRQVERMAYNKRKLSRRKDKK